MYVCLLPLMPDRPTRPSPSICGGLLETTAGRHARQLNATSAPRAPGLAGALRRTDTSAA
jgi:hypothetical protein